ncbi:PDC sensor domain-containing protein [Candidatus Omnitrophota bacterium]
MVKKIVSFFVAGVVFLTLINLAWANEDALRALVKRMAKQEFVVLANNPIIVNAVQKANIETEKSLEEIIQLDNRWQGSKDMDEWVNGFIDNPCADYLKEFEEKGAGLYSEIFVMDKQGCIVGETKKTTDYWQGDEDKFIKCFAGGKGAIFISEVYFDDSTQDYLAHASIPVIDPQTKHVIGAMTVGINMDILAEQLLR